MAGELSAKNRFPRLYNLEVNKNCLVDERVISQTEGNSQIVWNWKKDRKSASVQKEFQELLEMLPNYTFSVASAK